MGMDGYPQDLLGVMKLKNKYITESGNNRKFRKTSEKEQTVVAFTQTQDKGAKDKESSNRKWWSHCLHFINKDHWEADFPNTEDYQQGQLHTKVGTKNTIRTNNNTPQE